MKFDPARLAPIQKPEKLLQTSWRFGCAASKVQPSGGEVLIDHSHSPTSFVFAPKLRSNEEAAWPHSPAYRAGAISARHCFIIANAGDTFAHFCNSVRYQ